MSSNVIFVASSGTVRFSDLFQAFPVVGTLALGRLYAADGSIPSSGQLRITDFRGKTAPAPVLTYLTGSNISFGAGVLNGVTGGNISLDMRTWLANLNLTNHRGLTFAIVSGTAPTTGFSLCNNGLLTISSSMAQTQQALVIQVTNGWGRTSNIPLNLSVVTPITAVASSSINLTANNINDINLTSRFNNPAGESLSFTITSNPQSSGSLTTATNLRISALWRGTTPYTITVRATATPSNTTATWSVTVTESTASPPTTTSTIPSVTVYNGQPAITFNLNSYFSDPQGLSLTYSFTSQGGNVSISGSTLYISGLSLNAGSAYYNMGIVASNGRGGVSNSSTNSFAVNNVGNPPAISSTQTSFGNALYAAPYSVNLNQYFNNFSTVGASITYESGFSGTQGTSVTINATSSGDPYTGYGRQYDLIYIPNLRNATYAVTIRAYHWNGTSATFGIYFIEQAEPSYSLNNTMSGNYSPQYDPYRGSSMNISKLGAGLYYVSSFPGYSGAFYLYMDGGTQRYTLYNPGQVYKANNSIFYYYGSNPIFIELQAAGFANLGYSKQ